MSNFVCQPLSSAISLLHNNSNVEGRGWRARLGGGEGDSHNLVSHPLQHSLDLLKVDGH